MNTQHLQSFLENAGQHVASIRSSLLIVTQNGERTDELAVAASSLRQLRNESEQHGLSEVIDRITECEIEIDSLMAPNRTKAADYRVLDKVARVEEALLESPLLSGDLIPDLSEFLDSSFESFAPGERAYDEPEPVQAAAWLQQEFEVDEETLDIFRGEATELLGRIDADLTRLKSSPSDTSALWDIRRSAHTFKGAAGIVGLKEASEMAHMMEDLLDKLVELRRGADPETLALLIHAADSLGAVVGTRSTGESTHDLGERFAAALAGLTDSKGVAADAQTVEQIESTKTAVDRRTSPIVRVSLDRLDDLIELASELVGSMQSIERCISPLVAGQIDNNGNSVSVLLESGNAIAEGLAARLRGIRMQRFGTLETRLNRTVHVTSQEEGKKAVLLIKNGDTEIDTLFIDALVEPLLHLLRNSVVHGIEPPDTRRLIGKPEIGLITVTVGMSEDDLTLTVDDDGRGLSVDVLKEKCIAAGRLSAADAAAMDDSAAFDLIFERGLSTSESVNLNAGRGVGMSIVKESVEGLGGHVTIESVPQQGTRFVLTVPLKKASAEDSAPLDVIQGEIVRVDSTPLVLIVDDSASIRRHNARLIEDAGCRTITAIDGVEAVEILLSGNWKPDIIFSDVEMPRMDGWELLSTVKGSHDLHKIPVVLVTSLESDEHRLRARKMGAADLIVKPLLGMNVVNLLPPNFQLQQDQF